MLTIATTLFQQDGPGAGGAIVGGLMGLVWLVVGIAVLVAMWRVYVKAGQPGWAAIIPIYNLYVLTKIVGRPAWWVLLFFIPFVNFVILILLMMDLAKSFGKGTGFALGLIFLSPIFFMILGFGDARYVGPAAAVPGTAAMA
jgi:hypothetical protein